MSWRTVIINKRAKLDYKLGFLVVRGEETNKIYLNEIGLLMIESTAVSLTASLLCEICKRKIKVIFCDEKRNPCSELVPYYGSHDTSLKIRLQTEWSKEIKTALWTEIVTEKIRKQRDLLSALGRTESSMLDGYISEIVFGDETNREGHAAKVYFNALFGKNFTRSEECPVNAALNYGYSIILSMFNREITACGYITQLGLFHNNMFNQFNLSSDLMEPFRPLVDMCVYKMQPNDFGKDEKVNIISILNKEVVIGDKVNYVSNAVKIYCRSVFDALNENDMSLIRFYRNEL